ncbi:hypothetical protein T492DRAFT_1139708 [Pavlovales sp. CCMP2436]|nr:hypothetical protein T492DRAFT_1139708 [Pavlovales sp. CCMP2436]
MSAVAEADEIAHLKAQAPAWIELQRPSLRAVDLLSIKDLNQFVSDTRDQIRTSYLANAQIPPSRYTLTFISLTSVRNLVYTRQIHEQDALKTISARFKDSGKAKNIEQKRVDDALLLATEKKAKAAALRKQQRKEAAARKVVADRSGIYSVLITRWFVINVADLCYESTLEDNLIPRALPTAVQR